MAKPKKPTKEELKAAEVSKLGYDPEKQYPLEAFIEVKRINSYEVALLKLEPNASSKLQTIDVWVKELAEIMKRPAK